MFNQRDKNKLIDKSKIQTWLVTGASSGVGHEMCKQLLERGYNIIAVSRRVPDFEHENALCLSCDVTRPETIEDVIKKGIERFGKIDVLCNNAGISTSVVLEEEDLEHIKRFFETNFFGTFNVMKAIIPHFRENGNGTIINNSSMHGLSARKGGAAYCSTKHAIEGLTSVCLLECEKFCRTIVFELGWFKGTTIGYGDMGSKKSSIPEYSNIGYFTNFKYDFINNLDKAVSLIIDEAGKESPRRRLILGRDSQIKAELECNWLKADINYSKKYLGECFEYQYNFKKLVENYMFYYKYKFFKNFVFGKTRKRYKRKQKELHEKIRTVRKYMKAT